MSIELSDELGVRMSYEKNLQTIKENLKFLELREESSFGKVALKKGIIIPIDRETVASFEGGSFHFNFFHIVQNMLFCTSFCRELPSDGEYRAFLKTLFQETEAEFLQAPLDVRIYEAPLFRAGIFMSYSEFSQDPEVALMAAYEFLDLYHSEGDAEFLELAKAMLLRSFKKKKTAQVAYLLSYVHHVKEDYPLAIDYVERALELNPPEELEEAIKSDMVELNGLMEVMTVRSLMEEGNYVSALNYLLSGEEKDGWRHHYMLGEVYLALERPLDAIGSLKLALEQNPIEADIYESIGIASYFLGDVMNAITFFEHGLKLNPKHAEILKNLASLYSKTGRSEIGIKLLEKAKLFHPEDPDLDVLISNMKERLGQ